MKLVVDTNTIISVTLWLGPPARLIRRRSVGMLAAGADAIVTGDKDLLTLGTYESIPIVNAIEALRRLRIP